jgi:hypothetical protein
MADSIILVMAQPFKIGYYLFLHLAAYCPDNKSPSFLSGSKYISSSTLYNSFLSILYRVFHFQNNISFKFPETAAFTNGLQNSLAIKKPYP